MKNSLKRLLSMALVLCMVMSLFPVSALAEDVVPEEPHDHQYAESVTVAASCEAAGEKLFACECGASYTEEISATGHSYADGLCAGCGKEEPHEHQYAESVTVAASCEAAGEKLFACECGDSYTEVIAATGHSYADGLCTGCGKAEVKSDEQETAQCDCGTDDANWHSVNCAAFVMPENPSCDCAYNCTADGGNEWCAVCGFDAASCTYAEVEDPTWGDFAITTATLNTTDWRTNPTSILQAAGLGRTVLGVYTGEGGYRIDKNADWTAITSIINTEIILPANTTEVYVASVNGKGEYTHQATLTINNTVSGRLDTEVKLYSDVVIDYADAEISQEQIINAVLENVVASDGSAVENPSVSLKATLGNTIYNSEFKGSNSITAPGTYTVTVQYAGSEAYYPSEGSITFVVGKKTTMDHDDSVSYNFYNGATYSLTQFLKDINFSIKSSDDVVSINFENYEAYVNNGQLSLSVKKNYAGSSVSEINGPALYGLTVNYDGTDPYTDCGTGLLIDTIIVSESRPETTIIAANTFAKTNLASAMSKAQVLAALGFEVKAGETSVTKTVADASVKLEKHGTNDAGETTWTEITSLTDLGTYRLSANYAENENYLGSKLENHEFTVTDGRPEPYISIKDSGEVLVEEHSTWGNNWKSKIVDLMGIKVLTAAENGTEISGATVVLYTEAGSIIDDCPAGSKDPYRIYAKFAGNNDWSGAESAVAELTLNENPVDATLTKTVIGDATVTVTVDGKAGTWAGNTMSLAAGKTANISVTPDDSTNYYISELKLNGVSKEFGDDLSIDAVEKGTYTIEVTVSEKYDAVIDANETYNYDITDFSKEFVYSAEQAIKDFEAKVVIGDNVTIDGSTPEITVGGIEKVKHNSTPDDMYEFELTFKYAGGEKVKPVSDVKVKLTLTDMRPVSEIKVKGETPEDRNFNFYTSTISDEQVCAEVFDMVVNVNDEYAKIDGAKVSPKVFDFLGLAEYTITKGIGTVGRGIDLEDVNKHHINEIEGVYTITLQYAGDDAHAPAELAVNFYVTDIKTEVAADDETVEYKDISQIAADFDTLDEVKAVFDTLTAWEYKVVKNEANEDVNERIGEITGADIKISKITDADNNIIYDSETAYQPITTDGVYTVEFETAQTSTHKAGSGSAVLTIVDDRAQGTVKLETKVYKPGTEDFIISLDTVVSELYKGIDYGEIELYTPTVSKKLEKVGSSTVEVNEITSIGSYKLTISFAGDNTHKEASGYIEFSVSDGRPVPFFALSEDEISYDYSDGLSKAEFVEAIGIVTTVDDVETDIGEYDVTIINESGSDITDYEIGTYTVKLSYKGSNEYLFQDQDFTVSVANKRDDSVLTLKENASLPYKIGGYNEAEIISALFESLKVKNSDTDIALAAADETVQLGKDDVPSKGKLSASIKSAENAGDYDVSIEYSGDWDHNEVSATAKLTITKGTATVTVTEKQLHYTNDNVAGGYAVNDMITVEPDANHFTFAVGLSVGENASADADLNATLSLPDMGELNKYIQLLLGKTYSVEDLSADLNGILDGISSVEDVFGIDINTDSIEMLSSVLNSIPAVDGVSMSITVVDEVMVSNSGLYMVGAVVSDSNYETAYGMNYLVVSPDGKKAVLAWNEEDANGFYTIENIRNGNHNFGAYVSEVLEGNLADANAQVETVFLGVDLDGNTVMITDPTQLQLGVYTEIAYIADLGNEMYYAEPLIREVLVVTEAVQLKFIDENGNENPERVFTWENGVKREMKAVVYSQHGVELDAAEQAKITYTYLGMESDGDAYNSSTAPEKPGVYTVIAAYRDSQVLDETTKLGMAVGALVINPQTASIDVADLIRTYEAGQSDSLMGLITKTPADAKMAVMVAGISNVGDFSEQGLAAAEGVVLVDLPDRVEAALKKIQDSEYVTVDNFKTLAAPLVAALEAAGMETADIKAFYNELAALPGTLEVQLTDLSSYEFEDMGAYVVVAGVMDSDYYPVVDTGLVVIHPEVHEYTLAWNYDDANAIITRPVLESEDLLAHALDAESAKNADVTAKIKYTVYGVDDEGNTVSLSGDNSDAAFVAAMKALPNGVYTQIAYVEPEVDADITVAAPIMRQFILTPQDVTITVPNSFFNYGDDKLAAYPSSITVTMRNGTVYKATDLIGKGLTIKYIGANGTDGGYYREEMPVNAGVYGVFAEYKTLTETGELEHYGIGLGTLTIVPAALNYVVDDSVERYDGTAKAPTITNPKGASDILFIVDTQNATVNIVAPSLGQDKDPNYNWDGDLHLQYWLKELDEALAQAGTDKATVIAQLKSVLAEIEEITGITVIEDGALDELEKVLADIDSDLVTLNAGMPVEPGIYNIYAIAYKDPNHKLEISEGVLEIIKGFPIYFNKSELGEYIPGDMTVIIDGKGLDADDETADGLVECVLEEYDENTLVYWASEDDTARKMAMAYNYNNGTSQPNYQFSDAYKTYFWDLEYNKTDKSYTAKLLNPDGGTLDFGGVSIWAGSNAVNGIRLHHAFDKSVFETLGYTVKVNEAGKEDHGNIVEWTVSFEQDANGNITGSTPKAEIPNPTLRDDRTNSAIGVYMSQYGHYTNTAYPLNDEYIVPGLRISYYVVLEDKDTKEELVLYSGVVERSIGYTAYRAQGNSGALNPYIDVIVNKAADRGVTYGNG